MGLLIITVILLGLAFAGITIKIWGKSGGEFSGTCASQSPFLNGGGEPCGLCGKSSEDQDCERENLIHN